MRIVIDLQGAKFDQINEVNVDNFILKFALALVEISVHHEIHFLLNASFSEQAIAIRQKLHEVKNEDHIHIYEVPVTISENRWQRKSAELIRKHVIQKLNPTFLFSTMSDEKIDNCHLLSVEKFDEEFCGLILLEDIHDDFKRNWKQLSNARFDFIQKNNRTLEQLTTVLVFNEKDRSNLIEKTGISADKIKLAGKLLVKESEERNGFKVVAEQVLNGLSEILIEETLVHDNQLQKNSRVKPKLAYISPLPPERTGIADYSAELLPELAKFYEIDVVVTKETITDKWINEHCNVSLVDQFIKQQKEYDRVLYHIGNSPFHGHMLDLLGKVPGIVVLHEFYLGHLIQYKYQFDNFEKYLYQNQGYEAVLDSRHVQNAEQLAWKYPLNLAVVENSLGVIVHSPMNCDVAKQTYKMQFANQWSVIPLLRKPAFGQNRFESREKLKIQAEDFIVCCFGVLGPTKLNEQLLDAWLSSNLANQEHCQLIFVGSFDQSDYCQKLIEKVNNNKSKSRIFITGWADKESYADYLAAADVAVQLRTMSRGETSAAVLDCMNNGIATIVNANGTMSDLPNEAVYLLPDQFDDAELATALEKLWKNTTLREQFAKNAQAIVHQEHAPSACAKKYQTAIEAAYRKKGTTLRNLIQELASIKEISKEDRDLKILAQVVSNSSPPNVRQRQLLIDVSAIADTDLKTGIQRVVRAQLKVLLHHPPLGYRVEPVVLKTNGSSIFRYEYARDWTKAFLGIDNVNLLGDGEVECYAQDILFCADLNGFTVVKAHQEAGIYRKLMARGVKVYFQVFDILPVTHPHWFPKGAAEIHEQWCHVAAEADGVICISKAVADQFKDWLNKNDKRNYQGYKISHCHLGADIDTSVPSKGMPENGKQVLQTLSSSPSFLMVGTIEPRKGHTQTLAAFEELWTNGLDINLVIVGKRGWLVDDLINKIEQHEQLNKRLFWLSGISDEFLEAIYAVSKCLIVASEGEGFGLPLIEAAQHGLPIIARDIPVFNEVAGEYAFYFSGLDAQSLAKAIYAWIEKFQHKQIPESKNMSWLTWQQSTGQLVKQLGLETNNLMS